MHERRYGLLDRVLAELDTGLRVIAAPARAQRPSPAAEAADASLSPRERELAAALMRVNHAGEIAAQALYRGQAAVARSADLRAALLEAAAEEQDHLAWCAERVRELGSHTSLLAPAWYAGAFTIGALAGLAGDRYSLGFLDETEQQVTEHLDGHLARLPGQDLRSRRIVARMRDEELAHSRAARRRGAASLPRPLRRLMQAGARVMTTLAHIV